jgi:cell division protein FtsQ
MRAVNARGRASAKPQRSGGRNAPSRKAEPRAERAPRASGKTERERSGFWPFRRGGEGRSLLQRPMLLLTVVLSAGALGAGLWFGGYVTAARSGIGNAINGSFAAAGFSLERISVAGNQRTPADAVYGALGLEHGESIFAADPAEARKRLMALPWVADAVVRRKFPDSVEVTLFEKRPFALWQNGESLAVVERSGAVIPGQSGAGFPKLPILIGAGAPESAAPLIDALSNQRAISARLRGVERVGQRRWDLILDRGVRVRLPESGWEDQLAELERLIVDKGVLERDVEIIDLRYPDSYIFQLHNGDSRPVTRERPA